MQQNHHPLNSQQEPPLVSGQLAYQDSKQGTTIVHLIAFLIAFAGVGGVVVVVWDFWKRPVEPGPTVVRRQVWILIDPTDSMSPPELQQAKQIVRSKVLDMAGPGDSIYCYRILPHFSVVANHVFGDRALPGVPVNLLDPELAPRIEPEITTDLWKQVSQTITSDWIPKLEALSVPVDAEGKPLQGSGYLDALAYVAECAKQKEPGVQQRYLFVIGDLCQQPLAAPEAVPALAADQKEAFSDIEVRMVYPYRTREGSLFQADRLRKYWNDIFRHWGKEPDSVQLMPFNGVTTLLPQSSVPGKH
jgi:hypothetical protein